MGENRVVKGETGGTVGATVVIKGGRRRGREYDGVVT